MQKYSLLYDCRNGHSIRIPGFLKGVAMHDPKEVDPLKLQWSLQWEGFFGFWQYREVSLWERFGARKVFTSSLPWWLRLFQVTFNSQREIQRTPTISERSFSTAAAPADKQALSLFFPASIFFLIWLLTSFWIWYVSICLHCSESLQKANGSSLYSRTPENSWWKCLLNTHLVSVWPVS